MAGPLLHPGATTSSAQFGRYQLIATLGHGGMADVYLAVARGPVGFNKLQVIKRLRPNLAEEEGFLAMFLDEARLAARLNHPNVVQTNEVGEVDGAYFIAMEYLDGQPLNRILMRSRKMLDAGLSLPARISVVADALAGMHYAHELGDYDGTPLNVVHRDASPHNIFVTYDGQIKLVDFGIAKAASRTVETRTGMLKGKVAYMAPEQARCEYVDRRSDIFSIGVVLWEILVGDRMWQHSTDVHILDALASRQPMPSMRTMRPDLPEYLDGIVAKALALDPAVRYATADQMRLDLLGFLESIGQRRPSHEEIGRMVAQLFSDRRAKLKTIVDSQLSVLSSSQMSQDINILDLSPHAPTGSVFPPSDSQVIPIEDVESGTDRGTNPTLARAATVDSLTPPPHNRSTRGALFAGIAALAIGGAVAYLTLRDWSTMPWTEEPSAAATNGGETAGPEARPGPEPEMQHADVQLVVIAIEASPKTAEIYLDDQKLDSNPYKGEHLLDRGEHELRIEAKGYETETRTLRFDNNVHAVVELKKKAGGSVAVGRPRGPTATPKSTAKKDPDDPPKPASDPTGISGRPGSPDKRELDSSDPWAK